MATEPLLAAEESQSPLGSAPRGRSGLAALEVGRRAPLLLLALAVALLIVIPIGLLVVNAIDLGGRSVGMALASALPAMLNSAWTGVAATLLAVLAGTSLAILTERSRVPGRRALRLVMLVALIVPGYVAAVAWLRAYGPAGLLDGASGLALPALVGPLGIVLVLSVEAAPIAYLIAVAGLAQRAEPDLERAARACGATAFTCFRTITLPLLVPVLAASAAICFVLSVTAFGVPAVLGIPDGFATVTTRIYRDLAFSSDPLAFGRALSLAVALAVTATAAIALADRLLGSGRRSRSGVFGGPLAPPGGRSAGSPALSGGARRTAATSIAGLVAWSCVVVALILPLLALLLTALTRAPGLPPTPDHWTVDNFVRVLDRHTLGALANSGLLSAAAAVGAVLLGALAILVARQRRAAAVGSLPGLTFALPGSTLAVAILIAYGPALRDTLLLILVAYLAKFWLLGYRPLAAALESIAADAQRAARVSGASAWTAARTVTVPLLRPAIAVSLLIVFLFGLHEITMSSLLYGPGSATLAVVVLNFQQLGDPNLTAALAVLLTLVAAAAGLPLLKRFQALEGRAWKR